MLTSSFYESNLKIPARLNCPIEDEDLIRKYRRLDWKRSFLPQTLAEINIISCLNYLEQLLLDQIRGHSYLLRSCTNTIIINSKSKNNQFI